MAKAEDDGDNFGDSRLINPRFRRDGGGGGGGGGRGGGGGGGGGGGRRRRWLQPIKKLALRSREKWENYHGKGKRLTHFNGNAT